MEETPATTAIPQSRFQVSWMLFKKSLQLMKDNPKLLLFPIVTALCTISIFGFFVVALIFQPGSSFRRDTVEEARGSMSTQPSDTAHGSLDNAAANEESRRDEEHPEMVLFGAFAYFVSIFLATFFNVAFFHEIFDALDGKEVSLSDGFSYAIKRLPTILMWSLLAGLVGMIIRKLSEQFGFVGKLVISLIGMAWSIAAIFAIPIIASREDESNPLDILRHSATMIKNTWGESLIGYLGFQFGGLIAIGVSFLLLGAAGAAAYATENWWLLVAGIVVWIGAISAFAYVSSVAAQIYEAVLFRYAGGAPLPPGYTPEMMELGWKKT